LIRELALSPETLKLEITESTVMIDPTATAKMLQEIKAMGILLAIDDFGTGYSSLSYLHRFPLDTLKIDRSFISGAGDAGEGMEIAQTIMPMAKNLRLDVIAEGVETIEQVALLKKLQCKYAQGYYFPNRSRPRKWRCCWRGPCLVADKRILCPSGKTCSEKKSARSRCYLLLVGEVLRLFRTRRWLLS